MFEIKRDIIICRYIKDPEKRQQLLWKIADMNVNVTFENLVEELHPYDFAGKS